MRRRARERYARIKADAQACAAMLDGAREQQRERRSNGQGPRIRQLDRARYWRRRALGRGLTLEELAERTGVELELLLAVLADECRERRFGTTLPTAATGSCTARSTRRRCGPSSSWRSADF
jgi:hypothetical protein